MNYWNECVAESFEDAGIDATKEQIDTVAGWVEGAHDNYGMAFGYDAIPNPKDAEVKNLERKLAEIVEIYAGMEGFTPETAPEVYQERIILQMYHCAIDGINT